MKNFPSISIQLITSLREAHSDSVKHAKSLEELHYKQGQQSIIDYLEMIHNNQLNKRGK